MTVGPGVIADAVEQRVEAVVGEPVESQASLILRLGEPTEVTLDAATITTIASFRCDGGQARAYRVAIKPTGGSVYTREVILQHDGSSSADATSADLSSWWGDDVPSAELTTWDTDLSGSGTSQTIRLRAALANGGTIEFTEIPHRPAQR